MSPSATVPEKVSQLTADGVARTIAKTAPSIAQIGDGHSVLAELDASKLKFIPNLNPKSVPEPTDPVIDEQSACTDHMVTASWTASTGWHAPSIQPYGPIQLMPTASVLHYATECFEGMKLYRGYDGALRLFRPDCNARRMLISSTRISLPAFDPVELEKLIIALCAVDGEKWLPKSRPGTFLYLRPTMIANAAALGVQRPKEALLFIIACCFPKLDEPKLAPGEKPGMKLLASSNDIVRAWPGGFGFAKVGANYGPSLIAQGEARERGYNQILWLFGKEAKVTEAGASNFFVVWKTKEGKLELVTAPLGDKVILDGVTRRSVIGLVKERLPELEVVERTYTMPEVEEAVQEGRVVEAFAAGTAFFIAPVSIIHFRGKDLEIPMGPGDTGKYAGQIKTWLRNIMYGKEQHEWGVVIKETGVPSSSS